MGGASTQLVTSGVRPGGTVLIYGALSGPTLTLNTFDIFLRKRLEVPCSPALGVMRECRVLGKPKYMHVQRLTNPALARVSARLACMHARGPVQEPGWVQLAVLSVCETLARSSAWPCLSCFGRKSTVLH